MTKPITIGLTIALGLLGLALAVFVFGPANLPYWAEVSKFMPAVIVSIVAFAFAKDAKDKADAARDTAKRGADAAEAAQAETRAAREETRATMSNRAKRRLAETRGQAL